MKKIMVILISILTAFAIMSGGYGKWQKELKVVTDIVVMPDTSAINELIAQREQLILEEQRIQEEKRLLEEQKALEAQKLLEEQKALEEQQSLGEVNVEELEENGENFNIEIEVTGPTESVENETNNMDEEKIEEIVIEMINKEGPSPEGSNNQE